MGPLEYLRLSWRSIRGHKLRSALTTLGIVIGIAAVIAFVTLGASLQAGVLGDISPDDQRNLYGWAAEPETEGGPLAGAQPVFTEADLEVLAGAESIEAAYGYAPLSTQALVYENEPSPQSDALVAAGPSYIRPETLDEGRQFETGEREAVINPAVAGQFEENVSVGDELTIVLQGGQQTTVTVVGITEDSEGISPFEGFEPSPQVYVPTDPFYTEDAGGGIPIPGGDDGSLSPEDDDDTEFEDSNGTEFEETLESDDDLEAIQAVLEDADFEEDAEIDDADLETIQETLEAEFSDDEEPLEGAGTDEQEPLEDQALAQTDGDARYLAIVVEAESLAQEDIDAARDAAVSYLESDDSDASELLDEDLAVTLQTSTELLQQLQDVLDLLQNFIVGIAAISLVVGSIGIANIMLVSVTERTREIGIMKAVGAQNRDVLGLFLAEAVVLGVIGALLGTVLGLLAGYLGAWYIDLPLVYPIAYVALAIGVGVLVGIASGLYPAWRAARTDPIDALRYE